MGVIPNPWVILGFIGLLATSNAGSYVLGRKHANERTVAQNAVATVDALKTRGDINRKIGDLDAAGLCKELGGSWKDDACE